MSEPTTEELTLDVVRIMRRQIEDLRSKADRLEKACDELSGITAYGGPLQQLKPAEAIEVVMRGHGRPMKRAHILEELKKRGVAINPSTLSSILSKDARFHSPGYNEWEIAIPTHKPAPRGNPVQQDLVVPPTNGSSGLGAL